MISSFSTMKKTVVEVKGPSFTEIVGGTMTKKPVSGVKKILEKKLKHPDDKVNNIPFILTKMT